LMAALTRQAWIDASAGIAGDMLLAALIDAGADLSAAQRAVDAVVPGSVKLATRPVTRAGLRALKVDVQVLVDDPPHRSWRTIRGLLTEADLPERVRGDATAVFARLAEAEGRVHGIPAEDVHFHEVGALDSIADVVGVCAALDDLNVASVSAGEVSLGSGTIKSAHGELPVPVPAVLDLATGWRVRSGGQGELTTPTGMALLSALAVTGGELPELQVAAVGVGAGTKERPGRANVTRVVLGDPAPADSQPDQDGDPEILLEANVDDLDPRLWPGVLTTLLTAGASDAWLLPIVMKKGRPAHTLSVLCPRALAASIRDTILVETTTFGVRQHDVVKYALPRGWVDVELDGGTVAVKIAHRDGIIVQVSPEFDELAAVAARHSRPQQQLLAEAIAAATAAGLTPGALLPPAVRSNRSTL
jgi:pyridinium-3,5-bisthiocarboxylic acid mononucleotide nickel chelatase